MENRICQYCNKKMRGIGRSVKNGTPRHNDWITRKYHKKCFITVQKIKKLEFKYPSDKKAMKCTTHDMEKILSYYENIVTYDDILKYVDECSKKLTSFRAAIRKYQQTDKYKDYKRRYYLMRKQQKTIN